MEGFLIRHFPAGYWDDLLRRAVESGAQLAKVGQGVARQGHEPGPFMRRSAPR